MQPVFVFIFAKDDFGVGVLLVEGIVGIGSVAGRWVAVDVLVFRGVIEGVFSSGYVVRLSLLCLSQIWTKVFVAVSLFHCVESSVCPRYARSSYPYVVVVMLPECP